MMVVQLDVDVACCLGVIDVSAATLSILCMYLAAYGLSYVYGVCLAHRIATSLLLLCMVWLPPSAELRDVC